MSDDMVERVARAMCKADGLDPDADWRISDGIMLAVAVDKPERWRTYVRKARAAIEATPLKEMIEKMAQMRAALIEAQKLAELAEDLTGCRGDDDYVWGVQALISAALSPSPEVK